MLFYLENAVILIQHNCIPWHEYCNFVMLLIYTVTVLYNKPQPLTKDQLLQSLFCRLTVSYTGYVSFSIKFGSWSPES